MTDERGNVLVFTAISGAWMERLERSAAVEFGGAGAATEYIMTVAQARDGAAVRGTFTLAIEIGDALTSAVGDPIAALIAVTGGFPLMTGKVTDVERRTTKGFVRGLGRGRGPRRRRREAAQARDSEREPRRTRAGQGARLRA